jgi:hypothetical protein
MEGSTQSRNRQADNGRANSTRTGGNANADANGRLTGSQAVRHARQHLLDLTGKPCESVSSLVRRRDGWNVTLEVVELERIPQTTDIMASYLVELDEDGELLRYERTARYYRNQAGGGDDA